MAFPSIEEWKENQDRLRLSTEKMDFKAFRRAIRKLYKAVGLDRPKVFRVSSPMVGALVQYWLNIDKYDNELEFTGSKRNPRIVSRIVSSHNNRVMPYLEDVLSIKSIELLAQAKKKVAKITEQVKVGYDESNTMPTRLEDYLSVYRNTVWKTIGADDARVISEVSNSCGLIAGLHNIAIYSTSEVMLGWMGGFIWDQARVHQTETMFKSAVQHASIFLPTSKYVLVCDRPKILSVDASGRLHDNDKMAVMYRDGWGIYAIHGIIVPSKYVERKSNDIDPRDILRESNAQVRMAVISKVGFHHILKNIEYRLVSRAKKGRGDLIEMVIDGRVVRALHVFWNELDGPHETCIPVPATRDQFARVGPFVPDDIDDYEEVRWWTFGLRPSEIKIVGES